MGPGVSPRIVILLLFYPFTNPRACCSGERKRRAKDGHCQNSSYLTIFDTGRLRAPTNQLL
jgi:hypothetical protein